MSVAAERLLLVLRRAHGVDAVGLLRLFRGLATWALTTGHAKRGTLSRQSSSSLVVSVMVRAGWHSLNSLIGNRRRTTLQRGLGFSRWHVAIDLSLRANGD